MYEAEDLEKRERVALKTLRRRDSQALYALKREFRSLADIHHPNLALLHDLFAEPDNPFFTMEFIDGTDLRKFCTRPVPDSEPSPVAETVVETTAPLACDLERLRGILPQVAAGLHALHRNGLLHRDIKPTNLKVTPEGNVKILDFGLAVGVHSIQDETHHEHTVGTAAYMSPEQALGEVELSPASDWYSVGAMLFELLTGHPPFEGTNIKVMMEKQKEAAPEPRDLVSEVPDDLNSLCMDLLNRSPDDRPSGSEIIRRVSFETPKKTGKSARVDTIVFVGRSDDIARLNACYDSIGEKDNQVLLINGPSGIGKTTLIQEWSRGISHDDPELVFLAGRCYERESVRYRAMDGVIDELSRYWRKLPELQAGALLPKEPGRLSQLFPVLGRVPAIAGEPEPMTHEDPEIRRTRGYAAIRESFQRLGNRHRLVVFLDDMQWVDKDSVNLLVDMLRPPEPPRLLLVLGSRSCTREDSPILWELIQQLGPALDTLELGPLTTDDCRKLASLLIESDEEDQAGRLAQECEGNPFLLGEMARYVRSEEGAGTWSLRLEDVFGRRLATLNPDARRLLECACIAGGPIPVEVARNAAKLGAEELTGHLRMLSANHLLRTAGGEQEDHIESYHSRIQEIVVSTMPSGRQAEVHRELAVALNAWGGASDQALARHWIGAGDSARAAKHAKLAGDRALASTDFEAASDWYRTAVEQGDHSPDDARQLWALLGEALGFAGQPKEASAAFEQAADYSDRARALEFRRRSMEQLLGGGYVAAGLESAGRLLADVGLSLPKSTTSTLFRVVWNQLRNRVRGVKWNPRSKSDISADAMAQVQIALTVGTTLSNVDTLRANAVLGHALRLALDLGEPAAVVQATVVASCMASALNQKTRAEDLLKVAEQAAIMDGSLHSKGMAKAAQEFLAFFVENEWQKTTVLGDEVLDLFWAAGRGRFWERDACLLYRCFGRLYLGQLRQLSEDVSEHFQSAARSGNRLLDVSLRTGFRIRHLMQDDPEAALKDLREAVDTWLPVEVAFQVQHWYALWGRVEVALYMGDVDQAESDLAENKPRFEKSLLTHIGRLRCEYRHLLGRVALARGARCAPGDRAEHIGTAHKMAKMLRKETLPVAESFALMLDSGAAHLKGSSEPAVRLMRKTLQRLEDTETLLYAAATRRHLGLLLGNDEGHEMLEAGDAWMASEGVKRPDRMGAMLVPGWPHPDHDG